MQNLFSFVGLWGLMAVAWLFSSHRRVINLSVILWGVGLQLVFGAIVFWLPAGREAFSLLNQGVFSLLSFANEGILYVFGPLALPPGKAGSLGPILAFQVFPVAIFFAALMALLYYAGVMQWLLRFFSWLFTHLMRISGAEALCVSSNIFVGVESALTVRPYLARMTRSELCTILTGGMATIASTVLGLYALFLQKSFPSIAGHLISASIMTAPAALLMAKIVMPEVETPETLGVQVAPPEDTNHHWVEAIVRGATEGVKLIFGIAATLIAFVSLLALCNSLVGWLGGAMGAPQTTLQGMLSYVFYPLTLLMGVSTQDAWAVAELLAKRTILTEFPCYQQLAVMLQQGAIHEPRSAVIAVYALCGFAHLPSLGIFVGGFAAIAPERTADLGHVAFRALIAATLACMMTGAVAGIFFYGQETILLGAPKP